MTDFNTIATNYIEAFAETDPQRRLGLIGEVFAADVTYVDPLAAVEGHRGMDAMISGIHTQFPGWKFQLTGQADGHHAQARFSWSLGPEGEEPPVLGFDVINLDAHGRIKAVHGFLDRAPGA